MNVGAFANNPKECLFPYKTEKFRGLSDADFIALLLDQPYNINCLEWTRLKNNYGLPPADAQAYYRFALGGGRVC